jgi:hypothetical protein
MRRFLISLLFGVGYLAVCSVHGQDYQLYFSHTEKIFGLEYYRGLKVDSVHLSGNDSIFYLTRTLQTANPFIPSGSCFSPTEYGWAGDRVRINPSTGYHWIYTMYGDSIEIRSLAEVDETWNALQISPTEFLEAKVLSIEEMEFLGIVDTVKTIGFTGRNDQGQSFPYVNTQNLPIRISKHYGLINTWNFTRFPFGYEPIYNPIIYQTPRLFPIRGMSSPELGIQNLRREEIYDFQPGDVLHVVSGSLEEGVIEVREILSREGTNENPTYQVALARIGYLNDYANPANYQWSEADTLWTDMGLALAWEYYGQVDIDRLPHESTQDTARDGYTFNNMYMDEFGHRSKVSAQEVVLLTDEEQDGCWEETFYFSICNPIPFFEFREGLGGPYMECVGDDNGLDYFTRLVYYEKGDSIWGEPITWEPFLSTRDIKRNFRVYPNPTSGELFIDLPHAFDRLEVMDYSGRVLSEKKFSAVSQMKLDLSFLNKGIYLIRFWKGNKPVYNSKIILRT